MQTFFRYLVYGVICTVFCNEAQGQHADTLRITGTVLDLATGKAIEGATIVLHQTTDLMLMVNVMRSEQGNFSFLHVKEKTYKETVTHAGFKTYIQEFKI